MAWGRRLWLFLIASVCFMVMPAIPLATLAALVVDLVVHFVVRPAVLARHQPRTDPACVDFFLEPGELKLASTPATRSEPKPRLAGSLVLTDRRVWFVPRDWEAEPWSSSGMNIHSIARTPAPRMLGGLIHGLPDRILLDAGPPRPLTFLVPDAGEVASWPIPIANPNRSRNTPPVRTPG
jgi:hypothetical protein